MDSNELCKLLKGTKSSADFEAAIGYHISPLIKFTIILEVAETVSLEDVKNEVSIAKHLTVPNILKKVFKTIEKEAPKEMHELLFGYAIGAAGDAAHAVSDLKRADKVAEIVKNMVLLKTLVPEHYQEHADHMKAVVLKDKGKISAESLDEMLKSVMEKKGGDFSNDNINFNFG